MHDLNLETLGVSRRAFLRRRRHGERFAIRQPGSVERAPRRGGQTQLGAGKCGCLGCVGSGLHDRLGRC